MRFLVNASQNIKNSTKVATILKILPKEERECQ